ncbi:hypothetical protein L8S13_16510, partial [Vibrio lentus]|uniref:hypothetical protein n=1 Tax=Vibrio lentus TaxID=136468 RepID=UPI0024684BD3
DMLRAVLLLLFLFSLTANALENKQLLNKNNIEFFQENLNGLEANLNEFISTVEQSTINNSKAIEQNYVAIDKLGNTLIVQSDSQRELIELLNEVKQIKEPQADLQFAIETDVPYVITVSLSIFASIIITWLLLRKDLNRSHNRLIKEFRQKWIEELRELVSDFSDVANQLENFAYNNLKYNFSRSCLLKLEEVYTADLAKVKGDRNAASLIHENFTKNRVELESDGYELKNAEYGALISKATKIQSKIQLLLKPELSDKDVLDKNIFECIKKIESYLNSSEARYGTLKREDLTKMNAELLLSTRLLLKGEWDKIQKL